MADDAAGAVRRTPRLGPLTVPTGTPETAAPVAPGATNTATPVSQDTGTGTDDLSPEITEALAQVRHTAETFRSENPGLSASLRRYADDFERRSLGDDVDRVVAEYAALPECTACGGTGKDDHATVFETPLAVHFAGPPCVIAGRRRQLCMWCGHVLVDTPIDEHGHPAVTWPQGTLVRVEDGVGSVEPYEPGTELPAGCCALPDDEDPAQSDDTLTPVRGAGCYPPVDGWDGVSITAETAEDQAHDEADGRAEQQPAYESWPDEDGDHG